VLVLPSPMTGATAYQDVNGDGIPDALSPSSKPISPADHEYAYGVAVRHGIGNGTFGEEHFIEGPAGDLVGASDVTGDGLADLVTLANALFDDGPYLAVSPALPDGSFGLVVQSPTAVGGIYYKYSKHHGFGDVDGDGLDDLLFAAPGADLSDWALTVSRSTGDGHFEPTAVLPTTSFLMTVGDFNADGLLDAAVVEFTGVLNVYTATGQGDLSSTPLVSPVIAAPDLHLPSPASGDLDQDGYRDIVVAEYSISAQEGVLAVLPGNGTGEFPSASLLEVAGSNIPFTGDLNGDGWTDVVLGPIDSDLSPAAPTPLAACLNDGSGTLLPEVISGTSRSFDPYTNPPAALDLDGDGLADVGLSYILSGVGDGTFVDRTPIATIDDKAWLVAAADMDADGALDLVGTLSAADDAVAVVLGQGDGSFGELIRPTIPDDAYELAVGDVDGDGLPDLVLDQGVTSGPLTAVLNVGTGVDFAAPITLAPFDSSDIALADLDGNGSLDAVVTRVDKNGAWLMLGDGDGHFGLATEIPLGGKGLGVALADLDGEGTLDVVAAINVTKDLRFALGLGGGAFGPSQSLPLSWQPNHVAVADLDGNGFVDLASSNAGDAGVSVLMATGPALFAAPQDLLTPDDTVDIAASDLDRDARLDLVAAGKDALTFLHGHADGTFAEAQPYYSGGGVQNLALGDFDTDGFVDAAVGNQETFSVLFNRTTSFPSLGYQHDGGFGFPHLVGTGTPAPDELVSLTATGVPAGALGFLIVGLQFAPQPLAGGTLVPSPDVALPMGPDMPLAGRWPADLPAGTAVYFQAWFDAPSAELAASNALIGVTL